MGGNVIARSRKLDGSKGNRETEQKRAGVSAEIKMHGRGRKDLKNMVVVELTLKEEREEIISICLCQLIIYF